MCQNSALIIANGIRKFRKGVDIFDKKILILVSLSRTQCFRIRPCLQQSFPCSRQSINWYNSALCTTNQDSTLYVSIFLISSKRKGVEERTHPHSISALLFSLFSSRVYCHVIPHRVLFRHKKLEKVV